MRPDGQTRRASISGTFEPARRWSQRPPLRDAAHGRMYRYIELRTRAFATTSIYIWLSLGSVGQKATRVVIEDRLHRRLVDPGLAHHRREDRDGVAISGSLR